MQTPSIPAASALARKPVRFGELTSEQQETLKPYVPYLQSDIWYMRQVRHPLLDDLAQNASSTDKEDKVIQLIQASDKQSLQMMVEALAQLKQFIPGQRIMDALLQKLRG